MCGIAGALGQPDEAVLHRMNRILGHRGPDEQSALVDGPVGLAHTRLAIVDVNGSQQPLYGTDSTVLIVNGEIYNHTELRRTVSYPYQTVGDSEVILALHHEGSKGSTRSAAEHARWIKRLDGMFAFALWNPDERTLLLARDTLGIKPLFRTRVGDSLLFASEAKAFQAHEAYQPVLDRTAFGARLVWEYPLDSTSLLAGVHQVRPGTVEVWTVDEGGQPHLKDVAMFERSMVEPQDTWDPLTEAPELLDSFVTSVQQRLMADVPVGIVLSGGLDSSLVAAVAHEAAERAEQPVPACWTVAESEDNPDWMAAEDVAASFDLQHHQHVLEPDAFERTLPSLAWHGEDIDVTVLFFQPLFQHMRQHVTVGLCGQGADELHAGYPRYRALNDHGRELMEREQALPTDVHRALSDGNLSGHDGWFQPSHTASDPTRDLNSMLQFEFDHGQLSNFQLRLVDRHSMAHSLEVRVPFLGRPHRRLAQRLPMNWRLPDADIEKLALRRAAALTKLPRHIVDRPKLPAGRATSPTMIDAFLNGYAAQTETLMARYAEWAPAMKGQEELALGLGLFEAMHLNADGWQQRNRSVDAWLSEVI